MSLIVERPAAAPALTDIPDEWTVDVTEEDIQLGVPEDPWDCPIARATRRTLVLRNLMPDAGDVCVGYNGMDVFQRYVFDEVGSRRRRWTHDAYDFVGRFDEGLPVQPRTVRFTAA